MNYIYVLLKVDADIFKCKKFSPLHNLESPLKVANEGNKVEELIERWIIVKHINYFSKRKTKASKRRTRRNHLN